MFVSPFRVCCYLIWFDVSCSVVAQLLCICWLVVLVAVCIFACHSCSMYLVPASAVCSTRILFVIGSQHVFKNVFARFQMCRQWFPHVFSRVFEWILLIWWPLHRALLGSLFSVFCPSCFVVRFRCWVFVFVVCRVKIFWIQSSVVAYCFSCTGFCWQRLFYMCMSCSHVFLSLWTFWISILCVSDDRSCFYFSY